MTDVRVEVLQLLKEKRYEDALQFLYWARSKLPQNGELQRSVERVKELLFGSYAKQLGGLDKVAVALNSKLKRSPDVLLVARYIDGSSTFGDLAEICPLGRLKTLQVLVEVYCPEGEGHGEPHSGEQPVGQRPPIEDVEETAPITTRSSSSQPRPEQTEPPSPFSSPGPPSSHARDGVSSVGPDGKPYSIPQPGETHPFASKEDSSYRAAFERGTSAFVQKRFEEAVAAFEECMMLRPEDTPAQVMLRNCKRELSSQYSA